MVSLAVSAIASCSATRRCCPGGGCRDGLSSLCESVSHGRTVRRAQKLYDEALTHLRHAAENMRESDSYQGQFFETLCDQAASVRRTEGPIAAEPLFRQAVEFNRRSTSSKPFRSLSSRPRAVPRATWPTSCWSSTAMKNRWSSFDRRLAGFNKALSTAHAILEIKPQPFSGHSIWLNRFEWQAARRKRKVVGSRHRAASTVFEGQLSRRTPPAIFKRGPRWNRPS